MSDKAEQISPAPLIKRLMAIMYDLLLLTAILFAAGVVIAGITTFIINDGNAITEEHPFYYFYQAYLLISLLLVSFIFYGWFWTHGGQTLGMKTWRIKLIAENGAEINWKHAAIRFVSAIFSWSVCGMGFIWSLFDKQKRTWHDRLSKTLLIKLESS